MGVGRLVSSINWSFSGSMFIYQRVGSNKKDYFSKTWGSAYGCLWSVLVGETTGRSMLAAPKRTPTWSTSINIGYIMIYNDVWWRSLMRFMILLVEKSHLMEVANLTGTPFSWRSQTVWKSGMLLWLHKGFWPGVVFKYVFFRSRWMIARELLWAFEAAMLDEGWSDTLGGRPTTWWLCGPPTTKPSGPLVRRRYKGRDPGLGKYVSFSKVTYGNFGMCPNFGTKRHATF